MSAPLTSTRELVDRYLAGIGPAGDRIVERYQGWLLDQARRRLPTGRRRGLPRPEDAVQEVWLRLFASGWLSDYQDREHPRLPVRLARLLRSTIIDSLRRAGASKRGFDRLARSLESMCEEAGDGHAWVPASREPTPTSHARQIELLARIRRSVTDLQWEILHLKHAEELDSTEIGGRLGISSSAVRGHLARTLDRLALVMADDER